MSQPQFKASAYSVRLFMPHGDPYRLRIIDLTEFLALCPASIDP